jgi:hypothetical protein
VGHFSLRESSIASSEVLAGKAAASNCCAQYDAAQFNNDTHIEQGE